MALRFKDEPVGASFADLLALGARQGCSAAVSVDSRRKFSAKAVPLISLAMRDEGRVSPLGEHAATPSGGDDAMVRFALSAETIGAILRIADGPLDLFGIGMPEDLTLFSRDGVRWFWSSGSDEACGSELDVGAWARDVALSADLSRVRVTPNLDNLFDAGGAEELVGELAFPTGGHGGDGYDGSLRETILIREVRQGFRSRTPDEVLRSLGAAALLLDSRADQLGSIVWRRTQMVRTHIVADDMDMSLAAQTLRLGLSSPQWREAWPEVDGREAVRHELDQLLGS